MRNNAHLHVRRDAYRFAPPGATRSFHACDPRWDALGALERKYSPDQPRVPAGNPDGGQWTGDSPNFQGSPIRVAATVIRICIASGRSLSTDQFGNKSYSVTYQCAGGLSFTRFGLGHDFPGIVIDPFQ